jgi:hypothetical protein
VALGIAKTIKIANKKEPQHDVRGIEQHKPSPLMAATVGRGRHDP